MSLAVYIFAGLFLPLFPLSMPFNVLYTRLRNPLLRSLILLVWPQAGLAIISAFGDRMPAWMPAWGLATSLLYAVRVLALREVGLWTSFVGTSAWALLWILLGNGITVQQLKLYGVAVSVPLVLMTLLASGLERRFGAAYLGLYGGLSESIPRFTGVLVVVVLAIVATPLFPTFFAMLSMILRAIPKSPFVAIGVAAVWLLWSWAGARLLQGLLVGDANTVAPDISQSAVWLYVIVLGGLMIIGVYWSELMV